MPTTRTSVNISVDRTVQAQMICLVWPLQLSSSRPAGVLARASVPTTNLTSSASAGRHISVKVCTLLPVLSISNCPKLIFRPPSSRHLWYRFVHSSLANPPCPVNSKASNHNQARPGLEDLQRSASSSAAMARGRHPIMGLRMCHPMWPKCPIVLQTTSRTRRDN